MLRLSPLDGKVVGNDEKEDTKAGVDVGDEEEAVVVELYRFLE